MQIPVARPRAPARRCAADHREGVREPLSIRPRRNRRHREAHASLTRASRRRSRGHRRSTAAASGPRHRPRAGNVHDLARLQTAPTSRCGQEEVIEPDVRVPGGEREAGIRVSGSIGVHISGVENDLDGPPPDLAPAHPDERAQPSGQLAEVEQLARSQRVEVPREHMESRAGAALIASSSARSSTTRRLSVQAACTALRCTPKIRARRSRPAGFPERHAARSAACSSRSREPAAGS